MITTRPATVDDLDYMENLEKLCFSCPASREQLERSLRDSAQVLLCAEFNGEFAGCADFSFVLDEGYIGNVAVLPALRGRGVGRCLVEAMLRDAAARELAFLTLEVRRSNEPARSLYASAGFEPVGERKNYYEKPKEDAILMTAFLAKEAE